MLRGVLCETPELRFKFDRLYEQSSSIKKQSPLDVKIDSVHSRLRVSSLDFAPISGSKGCFIDRFLENCLRLAAIGIEPTQVGGPQATGPVRFNMKERIDAVEDDRVDMLYNLVSLQRMKKLSFISTPIRIGINGVMFQRQAGPVPAAQPESNVDHPGRQTRKRPRIHDARELLVYGRQPDADPFWVVTVRHEVGSVYMEQVHNLQEIANPQDKDALRYRCLDQQDTLDASFLATHMRRLSNTVPVMMVSDEHTALSVLRALNGDGVLILTPNSDQAVIHSEHRRIPPAYYFGFGLRRVNNWPLIDYMEHTIRTYLSLEAETIAYWYEQLYYELVAHITDCLKNTNIYVGSLRRTTNRVNDSPPPGADVPTWKSVRKTMVEQTARAVALRSLSLSRRSIQYLPPELADWRQILTRARERVQISDGADRGRIRNVIIYCAKMALGRDPLSPEPDPIELLRELVPSYERSFRPNLGSPDGAANRCGPVTQLDVSHGMMASSDAGSGTGGEGEGAVADQWESFLYLSERELDMDLSSLRRCPEREFVESRDLGKFISKVQKLLESSRDSQVVLAISEYKPKDRETFLRLLDDFATTPGTVGLRRQVKLDGSFDEGCASVRFVAYNLGEMVGFIEGEIGRQRLPTAERVRRTRTQKRQTFPI